MAFRLCKSEVLAPQIWSLTTQSDLITICELIYDCWQTCKIIEIRIIQCHCLGCVQSTEYWGWQWVSGWLLAGGHGGLLTNTHRQGDWPVSISSSPYLPWSIMMLKLKIRSNHWAQFLPDVDDWWRPLRDSCSATSHLHHDVFINILMSHHHIFNILVMFLISDVWKFLVDIFLWNMLF